MVNVVIGECTTLDHGGARALKAAHCALGVECVAKASVGIDDVSVGRQATNYLINTGYRGIAYASYTDHEGTPGNASRLRGEGFVSSAFTKARRAIASTLPRISGVSATRAM